MLSAITIAGVYAVAARFECIFCECVCVIRILERRMHEKERGIVRGRGHLYRAALGTAKAFLNRSASAFWVISATDMGCWWCCVFLALSLSADVLFVVVSYVVFLLVVCFAFEILCNHIWFACYSWLHVFCSLFLTLSFMALRILSVTSRPPFLLILFRLGLASSFIPIMGDMGLPYRSHIVFHLPFSFHFDFDCDENCKP